MSRLRTCAGPEGLPEGYRKRGESVCCEYLGNESGRPPSCLKQRGRVVPDLDRGGIKGEHEPGGPVHYSEDLPLKAAYPLALLVGAPLPAKARRADAADVPLDQAHVPVGSPLQGGRMHPGSRHLPDLRYGIWREAEREHRQSHRYDQRGEMAPLKAGVAGEAAPA